MGVTISATVFGHVIDVAGVNFKNCIGIILTRNLSIIYFKINFAYASLLARMIRCCVPFTVSHFNIHEL
jgi:hypothetical protein